LRLARIAEGRFDAAARAMAAKIRDKAVPINSTPPAAATD
jgi:hypothetical protein